MTISHSICPKCTAALNYERRPSWDRAPERARRLRPSRCWGSPLGLGDGENAVAVRNDLAARDLRCVRNRRVEGLIADPLRDELRRRAGLLNYLIEARKRRPELALAGETGQLAELRDERLLDPT